MNAVTVYDFVRAINTADIEKIYQLMSENHTFVDSQNNKLVGRDKMKDHWVRYFEMFPDYNIEIDETLTGDSMICLIGYASGTYLHKKDDRENNHWRIPAAWTAVVDHNHISQWKVYADSAVVSEIIKRAGKPAAKKK